jgi:hypothetical protein
MKLSLWSRFRRTILPSGIRNVEELDAMPEGKCHSKFECAAMLASARGTL